jgi:hypothetical protein
MTLEKIQKGLWEYLEKTRENAEKTLANLNPNFSTGQDWLELADTWVGDDFDEVFPGVRQLKKQTEEPDSAV